MIRDTMRVGGLSLLTLLMVPTTVLADRTVVSQSGHTYYLEAETWFITCDEETVNTDTTQVSVHLSGLEPLTESALTAAGFPDADILYNDLAGSFYVLAIPTGGDAFAYLDSLGSSDLFDWARFDLGIVPHSTPNDPLFDVQWGLSSSATSTPEGWSLQTGSGSVPIAVIDSGIERGHEDILGIHPNSSEFTEDPCGHGTAVAGVIGALANNNRGVAGVAGIWGGGTAANLIIRRTQSGAGGCYPASICELGAHIKAAADGGARVINISSGTPLTLACLPDIEAQITYATEVKDVVIVCSAGQGEGSNLGRLAYPASSPATIAVGAWLEDGSRLGFWNWRDPNGVQLDLMAPGGAGIVTTDLTGVPGLGWGDYTDGGLYGDTFGGTSAAAPFVSGVAGLVRAANPELNWTEVREVLRGSAMKVSDMQGQEFHAEWGYGVVNTNRALLYPLISFPTPGLEFQRGDTVEVTWRTPGNNTSLVRSKIEVSTNGGQDWSVLAGALASLDSPAVWPWVIDRDVSLTADAVIRVTSWNVEHQSDPARHFVSATSESFSIVAKEWAIPGDRDEISEALLYAGDGDQIHVGQPQFGPYEPFVVEKAVEIVASAYLPPVDGGTGLGAPNYAVELRHPLAVVDGLAIQGGNTACGFILGAEGGTFQNCTFTPSTGTDYAAMLYGNSAFVENSILYDGSQACVSMSGSEATLRDCTLISNGSDAVHLFSGTVQDCAITVSSGGSGSGVVGMAGAQGTIDGCSITLASGTAITLDGGVVTASNDTIRVTSGLDTNKGILSGGDVLNDDILISNCLITVPNGFGIYVENPNHEITQCTIVNTKWGVIDLEGGVVRQSIASDCLVGFETSGSNKAEYCIGWPVDNGFGTHSKGTGSVEVDPLFCGLGGEHEYTLRVDSYGNPGNNPPHYQIGAFPAECLFGTLTRPVQFAGDGGLLVPGDATIPWNLDLTLGAGTILDLYESEQKGSQAGDPDKVDLIVDGVLLMEGAPGNLVTVRSRADSPEAGDWNEIRVRNGGVAALDYTNVQHGTIGLRGDVGSTVEITHCEFANNESYDLKVVGSDNETRLLDNSVTVGGGTGIHFTFADSLGLLTLSGNTITGTAQSDTGLVIAGAAWDGQGLRPAQDITGNWLSGFPSGAGVRVTASGRPKLTGNSITTSMRGMDIVRTGGPDFFGDIGWSSANPNTITGNTIGLRCQSSWVKPRVRFNGISGNLIGVETRNDATPDLGLALPSDPGNNNLEGNTNYCISNRNALAPVDARGNYFGPCSGGIPPMCANGEVHVDGGVCTSPVSAADVDIIALPEQAPGAWLQYGVRPNPMTGTAVIHCALEKTPGPIRVRIFDVTGRLVRDFGVATVGPGGYSVTWNGVTETGSRARSGLYFVQFTGAGSSQRTAKLLVTR